VISSILSIDARRCKKDTEGRPVRERKNKKVRLMRRKRSRERERERGTTER